MLTPDIMSIIVTVVLAIGGLVAWFINNTFYKPMSEHLKECNTVPKSLLVEKIDNLCDRFDSHEQLDREMRTEVKDSVNNINKTLSLIMQNQGQSIQLKSKYTGTEEQ